MTQGRYWYLATPYTHYELGHEAAFRLASEQAALLMQAGIPVFCPISHSHPIADFGKLNNVDPDFWRRMDKPMLDGCYGVIYVLAEGYLRSSGMHNELVETLRAGKPVVFMEPGKFPTELIMKTPATTLEGTWPKTPKPPMHPDGAQHKTPTYPPGCRDINAGVPNEQITPTGERLWYAPGEQRSQQQQTVRGFTARASSLPDGSDRGVGG